MQVYMQVLCYWLMNRKNILTQNKINNTVNDKKGSKTNKYANKRLQYYRLQYPLARCRLCN